MESVGDMALVATKLTAPTLPGQLVQRPRLEDALDRAVQDPTIRVVLVSAPAGSGKSTLVAGWSMARTDGAWLQTDPADRDAARFWAHVVAALERVAPGIVETLRPHIAPSAGDPGPLIDRLVNILAHSSPVTLVIDDYHLVSNPAIDDAVERLIELAPDTLTLVLLTRLDPSIRLSRLRVTGRLLEVRAADLRFLEDEAAGLLDPHSGSVTTSATSTPPATDEQVRVLCARTEGWAAGLVLARMSLAAAGDQDAFVEAFRGDDRLVVDYLTDEFLAQTDADDRRRLIATSVLDEMSGPLVDAVCDTSDGISWLEELAARNQLVVGLGRSSEWYRYHHLLRDVLRMKAEASNTVDDLHRRAGAWHREHGDPDRAAEHLLEAGDLDAAADVIADHSMDLLNVGQVETVSGYLQRLGSAVSGHLRCALLVGWIHAVQGRTDDAERSLRQVRQGA
ncbi:MAG: AAA family ATPase [Actinomycetota bacterium]